MPKKILIADDSENVCDCVRSFAEAAGFEVCAVCEISAQMQTLIRQCGNFMPDIIILGGSYMQFSDECRHTMLLPNIYMLSSETGKYNLGMPVDISRLSALFEKYQPHKNVKPDGISLNPIDCCVTVGGKDFTLTLNEMDVLKCFLANPNRVFSKEQLAMEVFGTDAGSCISSAESAVELLKEKFDGISTSWSLKTLWGVGYKLEVIAV